MRSAPAFATARTSSPRRAKSADRMLGAMRNVMAAASLQCRHGAGEAPRHCGERSDAVPAGAIRRSERALRFRLHDHPAQRRQRGGAAHQPPLDHHRCAGSGAGSARPGRGRRAAPAAARRKLRVHQRRLDLDAGGDHARQLPDGRRGRHALRNADPGIHVVSAARASLILVVTPARPGPPDDERGERQGQTHLENNHPHSGLDCTGRRLRAIAAHSSCVPAVPADDERAAREFFEANFSPYALISSETGDSGLMTGYYEPVIEGSRAQDPLHRFPIFGVPQDLVVVDLVAINPDLRNLRLRGRLDGRRLIPYYSRAEIDARGTALPAPVIAWIADPVELFFLQVQGSGQIQLDSGERIRAGFADQNGHPYRSLGRYLVDRGEMPLEQASMQGIKAWAAANPAKLQDALNYNASYVFFRELPATDGPIGALSIPLITEYSLAVDRRFVPLNGEAVFCDQWNAQRAG